ncbi:TerB family tellurite resistance protein [Nitratireductor sp. GISD-1A_MAKvit]|uniref:TerB family tellurite resistance protein n=1 Tax=Nitratireductor sp. GISD-1A_MAKvit TaxID=3234198 RepID=UPI00346685FF
MSAALTAMAAEVLLLLRLSLTDDAIGPREAAVLDRIAAKCLQLSPGEISLLLRSFEVQSTDREIMQARAGLRQASYTRRIILAETLFSLAGQDPELAPRSERLGVRVCDVLGLGADEVAHLSG